MNEEALLIIQGVIRNWLNNNHYTYQQKEIFAKKSHIVIGEFILRFHNSLPFISQNEAPIELLSDPFQTTTLSLQLQNIEEEESENINADMYRLTNFLKEFDEKFYLYVEEQFPNNENEVFFLDL